MEKRTVEVNCPDVFQPLFTTDKKYIAIYGGRGSTKSWSVAQWIVFNASFGHRCLCFREVQVSIKESSFELIKATIERLNAPGFDIIDNEIRHESGGKIVFWGLKGGSKATEKTRAKSMEDFSKGWNEEAGSVTMEHLHLIMPTFRAKGAQIAFTYNRLSGAEPVHELLVDRPRTDAEIINVNYSDVLEYLDDDFIKEAEEMKKIDYDLWLHIYGGEPASEIDRAIIKRSDVVKAIERKVKPEGQIFIGADIARHGNDKTIFIKRQGMKVLDYRVYSKLDTVQVSAELINFAGNKNIVCNIDDTGVGGAVTDIIKNSGQAHNAINFAQEAKDKNKYPNAISEMWFETANDIDKMDIPDIRELKDELSNRIYTYDNHGRRRVEKKDDFKKRFGRSPDWADAFLLSFYIPKKHEYTSMDWG